MAFLNPYICFMIEEQQKRFILSLLAYAVQRGISAQQLCKLSNIDLAALKKKGPIAISDKQRDDLWLNASHLSGDLLFGLHFGESMQLSALGIVGEIIKTSSTIGEALTHAAAMIPLVTDLVSMQVTRSKKTFILEYIPTAAGKKQEDTFTFHQMLDLLMVFTIHELDGLLLRKVEPYAVQYSFKIPNAQEYERVLRCIPSRKAGKYTLEFENSYWDEPILTAHYELQKILLDAVTSISKESVSGQTLQSKIYTYLFSNAYLGVLTLEEVAANFNVSARSLQRKLQEEGITYQQLSDAVKKSLAVHYIQSGSYPLKEISAMLGYNELSAFTRAFKRWTGKAPVNYRG
jgi:AraC-like DNA-binding protein